MDDFHMVIYFSLYHQHISRPLMTSAIYLDFIYIHATFFSLRSRAMIMTR
jgi:hypothetical protein